MRILHTIASIDPATGGPARSVPQLLMALKSAGLEVALWTAELAQSEWHRPLQERGISVFIGDLADLPAFDLIHDHGLWLMNNHRVASYARAIGIPRIVSPRGMLEPWALNHKKWKKRAAWWLYQHRDLNSAAALHATADSEADQFRQLGLKVPIHVIPNGVEISGDRGRSEEIEDRRSKIEDAEYTSSSSLSTINNQQSSISSSPPIQNSSSNIQNSSSSPSPHLPSCPSNQQSTIINQQSSISPSSHQPSTINYQLSPISSSKTALFLSRIHPKKGLPMLVEAWAKVRPQGWRMRVVGPDENGHRAEVESMVAKAGLENEWTFEGAHDDEAKWECYRAADLFILPTYSENFGIAVAEALSVGIPVITTTGTPWEGLQEHQCGWWVEPTVAGLSKALIKATSLSPPDRAAMGFRGRKWVSDEFTWSGIASRMSVAYSQILMNPSDITISPNKDIALSKDIAKSQGDLP